jgi:Tfp pilus assembly protein PilF
VLFALVILLAPPAFDEAFRTGLLALQRNDLKTAQQNLTAASELAPSNGRVWIALAQVYRREGDSAKAQATADKACSLAPKDPVVLDAFAAFSFDLAQPLLEAQKFAEAAKVLETARKRVPPNAQIELASGVAYYGLRRFDEAADAFLKTTDLAPEIDRPYIFLGKILDQIPARQAAATERFARYQAAHPASATGYLLHAQGLDAQALDPEQARTLIAKSLAIDPSNADAHFEMGNVLDRLRDFDKAAREFERAAELKPSDAATHYRLARDYERLGRAEDARKQRELHAALIAAQEPIR